MRDFVEEDRITTIEANRAQLMSWLKAGAPHMIFDMSYGVIDLEYAKVDTDATCGTVCCIAGAAALMSKGQIGLPAKETFFDEALFFRISRAALEFLGLEREPHTGYDHALFDPKGNNGPNGPAEAAIALQRAFDGLDPWDFG